MRRRTRPEREARLEAERAGAAEIRFPESLTSRRDQPEVAKVLDAENALFEARRRSTKGRIHIFHKRIAQLNKEISGLQAQVAAEEEQLALIENERSGASYFLARVAIDAAEIKKLDGRELSGVLNSLYDLHLSILKMEVVNGE